MKVFITKYALTEGILELEPKEPPTDDKVLVRLPGSSYDSSFYGKDWHSTFEDAEKRANAMLAAEIVRIEKKLVHLRRMTFTKK